MTDRELLELAAKAAGLELSWYEIGADDQDCDAGWYCDIKDTRCGWCPLTDDGDALRLAVKLGLTISPYASGLFVSRYDHEDMISEAWGDDRSATTRRAIVRCAAELGKSPVSAPGAVEGGKT